MLLDTLGAASYLPSTTGAGRSLNSESVLERLAYLFVYRGVPAHIRSDNGSEFTAHAMRDWLAKIGVTTLYIEPGSPWENGYVESFNGKLQDELLGSGHQETARPRQAMTADARGRARDQYWP